MQRRSFFKRLFGAVLAGLAAPRVEASVVEPLPVDCYQPYQPLPPGLAGEYRYVIKPDANYGFFPLEGGSYKPGEPFKVTGGPMSVPITDKDDSAA